MKTFHFSLEAICTLREQQEQVALTAYEQARQQVEKASRSLELATEALEQAAQSFQKRLELGERGAELSRARDHLERLNQNRSEAEYSFNTARYRAEQCYVSLLAARKASAVLEKYCETQEGRFHAKEQRREQKLIDDLVNARKRLHPALLPNHPLRWR